MGAAVKAPAAVSSPDDVVVDGLIVDSSGAAFCFSPNLESAVTARVCVSNLAWVNLLTDGRDCSVLYPEDSIASRIASPPRLNISRSVRRNGWTVLASGRPASNNSRVLAINACINAT